MQFKIFTISSLRRELSPACMLKWPGSNHVQITCNTSSAYLMQPAVCHFVQRDSSAILFDRVEITFIFTFILLPETGAGIAQLVVLGLAVHSVAGSILLWGHFW